MDKQRMNNENEDIIDLEELLGREQLRNIQPFE